MSNAHIKKMFPGAVTSQGFYSYYHYMIQQNANRIFVLKGGPGVGKSSFMKKIAQSMLDLGYDIEYHCCSSDNGSIDGIVIPKLNIGLLDGTAPHVVDPKNPGAVDEIINLGEYWNEEILTNSREDIAAYSSKASNYYPRVYFALNEAKIALSEWKHYISAHQDWSQINQMTLKIQREIFKTTPKENGKERHLFAWGLTPQGKVQFIDTLLDKTETLYILKGQPGTGKSTFLSKIAERATLYGLNIEYYHNTLDPEKLDLIILPEIKTAFVIDCEPYAYTPSFSGKIMTLDFGQSINIHKLLVDCGEEIQDCQIRVNQHISRALKHLSKAKAAHDLLEKYYIPAMNFSEVESKMKLVLEKILSYTKEEAVAVSSNLPRSKS